MQENTSDQFVKTEALFQYLTQLILFIIKISKSTHNSPFFAGFQTETKDRLSLNLLIIIQLNSLLLSSSNLMLQTHVYRHATFE